MMRENLIQYIEENIFPGYEKNDGGHGIEHIQSVIRRSFKFAKQVPGINKEMVYVIACYHDIGVSIDRKHHEKVSADILRQDTMIKKFFHADEIEIMAEAIEDHRASMEGQPRSIYGKIVSSADRNTDVDDSLKRTYTYRLKHFPYSSLDEIIEDSRNHLIEKFGVNGYSREKFYFKDLEAKKFLDDIVHLTNDKDAFIKRYKQVNHFK